MNTKQTDARIKHATHEPARLGLFGGSFDPVHCAHLKIARCALEQAQLDRVIFVPTAQSPLKLHKPLSEDTERLRMLNLALEGETDFEMNTYEIDRGGVNYSIDTVLYFQELYGNSKLFLIIGGDQFEQLDRWHRVHELVRYVTFLIYPRPVATHLPFRSIVDIHCQVIEAPLMETGSTRIRKRCREGLSLEGEVPSAVEAFILEHGLYK